MNKNSNVNNLPGNLEERELYWRAMAEKERKYIEHKEKKFYNSYSNNYTI